MEQNGKARYKEWKKSITTGRRGFGSRLAQFFVYVGIVFTISMLLLVIGYVLMRGVPHIKPDLFSLNYSVKNQSLMPAVWNTIELIALTLLICVPVGVFTAIYMVEYAKPGNRFVKIVRVMTETLQGIPSIIFGLFGMLFFSNTLGWGNAIISGAMTMVLMCLPLIIRATEEALLSVPRKLREASYGLGARKLRTVFQIVLPAASMGIFAGIILAIGRVVGETAALIYTAGSMAQYASPTMNGRTLAIHMYQLSTEGKYREEAFATSVVLLIVVFIINSISTMVEQKLAREERGDE